jgi:hypothetical protein
MPRVRCLPRAGLLMRQRGETPARKEMRGRMAGSTAQGSRQRDPHLYERRRTQGPGPRRRVDMHGAALVRIPNPSAKSEALPSRPFLYCPRRLAFREPAAVDVCRGASLLEAQDSSNRAETHLRHPRPSVAEPRRRPGIQRKSCQRRNIEPLAHLTLDPRMSSLCSSIRG